MQKGVNRNKKTACYIKRMDYSDEDLVQRYREGDRKSLDILIGRYFSPLYNFIYRLSGKSEDTNDITQDVFVKTWKNIKKFDRKQKFKTWIFTIARNTTIDWFRKKRDITFSNFENEDGENVLLNTTADDAPLPDAIFRNKELAKVLEEALEKIPVNYRTIILLHDTEELTFEEIADVVGKPMNTVKSQYRRGLEALREKLTKE